MKKVKVLLDVIMFLALILLMSEHMLNGIIHEILGISLFLMFLFHNILNYKWYKLLFKRKVNKKMFPYVIINFLILVCFILVFISSLMLKGYIFKRFMYLSRSIHMVSSISLFILTSIHLGMHLNVFIRKLNSKVVFKICEVIIIVVGLICFIIIDKMYEEMFFLVRFKDFKNTFIIVEIIKKLFSSLSISLITFNIKNIRRKR